MNCSEAQELLPEYLGGLLDTPRREGLEAHLNQCAACSRQVAELRRTIELLDDAYAGVAVDARDRAPQVAQRAAAAANARRTMMERRSRSAVLWKVAAALVVAGGLAGLVSVLSSPRGQQPERSRQGERQEAAAGAPAEREMEQTGIGRVELRRGVVGIRPPLRARWSLAREDRSLEPNEFIRVGDDPFACARVALANDVAVSMNSSSIVQYVAKDHVQVLAGEVHVAVPAGTPLTVDTPLCSLGVKGTSFDVSVVPGQTSVAVSEGVVAVAAHGRQVELEAGKSCVVTAEEITQGAVGEAEAWLAKLEGLSAEETLGRLLVTIDGQDVPLSVKSHKVKVTIRDQIAYTLIDEEFENHTSRRLEGTFYYPLPAGASISRFAMYIGDTLMEGEVVERMRAREVYESIVRRRRDPALLEWMGGNQFKARVFPIEPHSTKRVFIGYTQVLPRDGDVVRYTYPLKSEKLTKNPLSFLRIEVDAYSTPAIADFESPTHNCNIDADDHRGRALFSAANYAPARDFAISYTVTGASAELYTVPHWRDDEGGYFLAFLSPRSIALMEDSDAGAAPANVLLVIDTSASMAGDNFAVAQRIAATYLNFLGDKDRFNILLYDVAPRLMFPEFFDNLPEFRSIARQKLAEEDPFGAGDLGRAISEAAKALDLAHTEGGPVLTKILYIGDGVATIGETEPAKLLEAAEAAFADRNVTVSTFAVGSEYDQTLIEGLARQFGGVAKVVSSARPVEEIVGEMVDDSFKPMITDLALSFEGVEVHDVYPHSVPNVLVGGQVIVAGRYKKGGQGTLIAMGFAGDEMYRREIAVALPEEKGPNTFVPRLWARRCMDDMLYRIGRGEGELVGDVIDLSLKYKLMSPYTSFLVLETEDDYKRFGIDRRFSMEQWAGAAPGPGTKGKAARLESASETTVFERHEAEEGGQADWGAVDAFWKDAPRLGDDLYFEDANGRFDSWAASTELDLDLVGDKEIEMQRRVRLDEAFAFRGRQSMSLLRSAAPESLLAPAYAPRRRAAAAAKPFSGLIDGREWQLAQKGSSSSGRRYNRGSTLYPQAHVQPEQPEPEAPDVGAEVREVIECFARGPVDFALEMKSEYYDQDGKVRSERESVYTVIGKRFSAEDRTKGTVTSRTVSDGERRYRCYDRLNYATAQKLLRLDYARQSRNLPGMAGYSVDDFLRTYGAPKIESREGDVTVLATEQGNSRRRFFVDTARKTLTKIETSYRQSEEGEFKLHASAAHDEFRVAGGRAVPMRVRNYNAEGKLTATVTYDAVEIGEVKGEHLFAPPPGMLIATYPLPSIAEAKRAVKENQDDAEANFALALALEQGGMFGEAAKAAERVVAARPEDPYVLLYLGWLKTAAGDRDALHKAAEKGEEIIRASVARGGIPAVEREQEERTRRYEFFKMVCRLLDSTGLHNERQRYIEVLYETAEKGDSERVNWASQLAAAYASSGEPRKGYEVWRQVLEEAPDSGYAWHQAAQFMQNQAAFADEAEEAFIKARELGYNIGEQLAYYYQNRGEWEKAVVEWRRSFEKRLQAWNFRNFLQGVANELGSEEAAKEAEQLIAAQEDPERRKQAMLGHLYFVRDDEWRGDLGEVCRQLHEAYPEDTQVLRELLQASAHYYSPYDPMPAITKLLATEPKDYQQAAKLLQLVSTMASYGFKEEAARFLEPLEKPGFEMDAQQEAGYLYNLANAEQNIDPEKAAEAWRRMLKLDLPENDYRLRRAREQIFYASINSGDFEAAQKMLMETLERDRQDYNLNSMWERLVDALRQQKKFDELIALYTRLQQAVPEMSHFWRLQAAVVLASQDKTQGAYDELRSILQDTDAALRRYEAEEGDSDGEEAYYFYQAGRALIRVTSEGDDLKGEFDKLVAARAGDEKPDGDQRWTALLVDLLRERGKFAELVALLEKLAAQEKEGDEWQRYLAAAYAATRKYAQAEAAYSKLVAKDPKDVGALMELSRLAAAQKQGARADEYWHKWLEAVPDDEDYLRQMGRQLSERGDSRRAIAVYEKVLGFARYPENTLNELVREYQKTDRKLDAAMVYIRATRPAPDRQRRPYNHFNNIWPLITEEGTFSKFTAAVEQEITDNDDPDRKARLMGLMAQVHTKRGDKDTATRWAEKAMAGPPAMDEESLDAVLAAMKEVHPAEEVVRLLRKLLDDAGAEAPEWLRVRLARELFAAKQPEEGEKLLRGLIDASRPSARHDKMLLLASLVAESDLPRALEICDEVARDAQGRRAAQALRARADLMAASKDYPPADVIEAYRAAAAAGSLNERKAAAQALAAFARNAKEHDAVVEAYKLLCRSDRRNANDYVRQARDYLLENKLDERAETMLREMLAAARNNRDYGGAWSEFGRYFSQRGEAAKAVEIWAEGLKAVSPNRRQYHHRHNLISHICDALRDEKRNKDIDRELVGRALFDELELHLVNSRLADYGWPGLFWDAIRRLELTDKALAMLEAAPEGQRRTGDAYRCIGDVFRNHLQQPDNALKYYRMALDAPALRNRSGVLDQMMNIFKEKQEWQKALDCVNEMMKSDQGYHRKMHQAFFLAKLGQTEAALKGYEEASQKVGRRKWDYQNHHSVGTSAFEAGLYDFAIKELTLGLRMHDFYRRGDNRDQHYISESFRYLARCHRAKGEIEEAVDMVLRGVTRVGDGYRRQLYDEAKTTLRESGKLDEFIAKYEQDAEKTRTEKPGLRTVFGDVFYDKQDYDTALRHYKAALEVAPTGAEARERVMDILRRTGRTEEMIDQYRERARFDPKNVRHYREMGRMLQRAGREAEALRAYTTMLEAMPTEAESHREMARVYSDLHRHEDAIAMWKKVVQYRPEEPRSYYGLAESYVTNNQPGQAVAVYNEMTKKTWDQRFGDVRGEIQRRLRDSGRN